MVILVAVLLSSHPSRHPQPCDPQERESLWNVKPPLVGNHRTVNTCFVLLWIVDLHVGSMDVCCVNNSQTTWKTISATEENNRIRGHNYEIKSKWGDFIIYIGLFEETATRELRNPCQPCSRLRIIWFLLLNCDLMSLHTGTFVYDLSSSVGVNNNTTAKHINSKTKHSFFLT